MYVCKFCATIKGNHKKLKKFNKKKKTNNEKQNKCKVKF